MQSQATYNYKVVRQFAIMTVVWGIVGMLVGVIAAAQLVWPELNVHEYLHFGRLRPLHTNAVIFAFGGCALFATSYFVVQRTNHTTLFARWLASFTFWGWQLVIALAVITLPLGFTSGKEYAELEWPIDILIAAVWVSYAVVFFVTLTAQGSVDVSISDGTSVIPAASQGIPIRYVATIYGTFPNIVFAKASSGITSAADLKGKRLGTPGKYGSSWIMLQALLGSAGLTTSDLS